MNYKGIEKVRKGELVYYRSGYGSCEYSLREVEKITVNRIHLIGISNPFYRTGTKYIEGGTEVDNSNLWHRSHIYPVTAENEAEVKNIQREKALECVQNTMAPYIATVIKRSDFDTIDQVIRLLKLEGTPTVAMLSSFFKPYLKDK